MCVAAIACPAWCQTPAAPTITLADALTRAKQYGGQIQSANLSVLLAKEDSAQARAGRLPTVSAFNQFIYTEGNGTPSGVFVANDGVHVYNEQAQVHEEVLSIFRRGEIRRAAAAQAVASAKVEVASRGLVATVIQNYYAIAAAEHKLVNARVSLGEAERFLGITQKQEKGGEAAHADVIKAQIQQQQRMRDVQDAQVAIEKAKIALGVAAFAVAGFLLRHQCESAGDRQSAGKRIGQEHAAELSGGEPAQPGLFGTGDAEHSGVELGCDAEQD
jgi:outer membrane protein TolC